MAFFLKADGPTGGCQKCGCNEATKVGNVMRWGSTWQKWRCGNCGHEWSTTPDQEPEYRKKLPTVEFSANPCPHCGSTKTRVTRTMRPIRYHVCDDCKETFKSHEKPQSGGYEAGKS